MGERIIVSVLRIGMPVFWLGARMIVKRFLFVALIAGGFALIGSSASAQTICPTTAIANGNPADATLVTSWFSCKAPTDNPSFTGNASIGTAASNSLTVQGGTNYTPLAIDSSGTTTFLKVLNGGSTKGYFGYTSAGSAGLAFYNAAGSSINFLVTNSGNTGFGTAYPSAKLVVSNNQAEGLEIAPGSGAGVDYLQFYNRTASTYDAVRLIGASFRFEINGTEKFRVDSNGNVGVGTTSPDATALLDLVTETAWSSGWKGNLRLKSSNYPAVRFFSTAANKTSYIGNNNDGSLRFGVNGSGDAAGTEALVVASSAKVGVGTPTPGQALDVVGTIRQSNCTTAGTLSANTSGDIICTSDARLKDIRGDYVDGLNAVMQIKPKLFSLKPTKTDPVETFIHAGFIAQNVRAAIPQASAVQRDGYYSLDTTAILAAAVNSIKQLKLENDRQSDEIRTLRAQHSEEAAGISKLRQEVSALRARFKVQTAQR